MSRPSPPRLGYLSAAPTVSTRPDAYSAGPRAHILGVINGFRTQGWTVDPFIVGDRVGRKVTKGTLQASLERWPALRPVGDAARLLLAARNRRAAWAELGSRVDWVYERFATMQVLGRRFKKQGIPWILETQGLFYYETRVERSTVGLSRLAERIEKAAYRDCDALICISPALKELIVEECGVPPDKILVVPNAVELERFDLEQVDLEKNPNMRYFEDPTIGFVGALIGWQVLDRLIEALGDLAREGLRFGLVVVGDGVMRESWEALAGRCGIADRVRFLGRVPATEVGRYMAGFDIGYAGAAAMQIGTMYHSPIKLYEYMAMAKPLLASDFADARQLVEGRDTGFLFAADQPESLKAALRRVHAERYRLPRMGQAARSLVAAEHTWQARAAAMIESLDSLLAAPSPARNASLPITRELAAP